MATILFAKVKGLISEMISRLEDKASADATHMAYCDKELSESRAKEEAKLAELEKLRAEEKDAFATNKRDLEDGIEGVRSALGVLRDNNGGADTAHATAGESGGSIGLL